MRLSDEEKAMLGGDRGEAAARAMDGLVQLGEAFGADDMVEIGYAHVHPGMALYAQDVELMEELAALGARVSVPTTANVVNVDTENWQFTGAPESLARLHRRGVSAHREIGCVSAMTCTPYWAGHWPTWNMHMTSIESGVTVFCNSVLGARSNRDGFFSVYAAIAGRYPRFGYHLDENRRGTHHIQVAADVRGSTDFGCMGAFVGEIVGSDVPVFDGFLRRPTLDELDALGAGLATTGGVSMFIVPGVTPPFASVDDAFPRGSRREVVSVQARDIDAIYERFADDSSGVPVDFVHIGCPHASFQEMRDYARLLEGQKVAASVQLWITTSRAVRALADQEGIVELLERAGAHVITDTCPMTTHFARTTSPDRHIELKPPWMRKMVVDSVKQAKYVRDMVRCETLLTSTEAAVLTATTGRFVDRRAV